jgi:hypothetical protein
VVAGLQARAKKRALLLALVAHILEELLLQPYGIIGLLQSKNATLIVRIDGPEKKEEKSHPSHAYIGAGGGSRAMWGGSSGWWGRIG